MTVITNKPNIPPHLMCIIPSICLFNDPNKCAAFKKKMEKNSKALLAVEEPYIPDEPKNIQLEE